MYVTLVKDTQHDIHRGDGGDNQDHLRVHRLWNTCAVPAKLPRTVEGTPSWVIARSIAVLASESDFPVGRLNEMVEAADNP